MNYLPRRERRQTLLFSATMPTDVEQIARVALKDRYEFVDCVGREENTHQHVPQEFTVCTQENQVLCYVTVQMHGLLWTSSSSLPVCFV